MTLQEKLKYDLNRAMKMGDKARRSAIRLVMAGVRNAEIAQGGPLDDSGVLGVIAKESKQRRESIEAFNRGNRQDLVAQEQAELAVLLEYLPQQMSRQEITVATVDTEPFRKERSSTCASPDRICWSTMGKWVPCLLASTEHRPDALPALRR